MAHPAFRAGLCVLVGAVLAAAGCSRRLNPFAGTKFRVQEVVDAPQGGLVAFRFAVPQDWKASGHIEWHYNDLYTPMRAFARAQAPDGSAWIETYPFELFYWLDPRWDNAKQRGAGSVGGIHHPNISIQDAMRLYVIAKYRGKEKNLKILGWRPVKNLAAALGQPSVTGEGVDFRIRYDTAAGPVDEEFFGLMTPVVTIPYHGPQGTTYEYHHNLGFVHSLGARNGKLESVRPILGYIAHSFVYDKVWQQHQEAVMKQLSDAFNQNLAAGYARIAAAGRLSRAISANNDAMIKSMDAQRAASATRSSSQADAGIAAAENFDHYIRDTEMVEDSSGKQSEVTSSYSYHWTDGFGTFVHSNDPNFDPNNTSNVPYEKTKPVR
jgi:hypothetical protein